MRPGLQHYVQTTTRLCETFLSLVVWNLFLFCCSSCVLSCGVVWCGVVAISAGDCDVVDTLNTMKLVSTARSIVNKPVVVQVTWHPPPPHSPPHTQCTRWPQKRQTPNWCRQLREILSHLSSVPRNEFEHLLRTDIQKTIKDISFHQVVPIILVCVPCPRSTFAHATLICTFLTN